MKKYVIQARTGELFDAEFGWAPNAPSDKHRGERGPMRFATREAAEKFMTTTFDQKTLHTMGIAEEGLKKETC